LAANGRTTAWINTKLTTGSMASYTRSMSTADITALVNWLLPAGTATVTATATATATTGSVSYSATVQPILSGYCSCHPTSGVSFSSYANTLNTVVAGNAASSRLYQSLMGTGGVTKMPPRSSSQLTAAQITAIQNWINQGALNN
ncbi:MAG: hypothetical protein WCE94_04565, partial [Candidatus Methanoperedens sp.]